MGILLWGGESHCTVHAFPSPQPGGRIKVPIQTRYPYIPEILQTLSYEDICPKVDVYEVAEFWWRDSDSFNTFLVGVHTEANKKDFEDTFNLMANVNLIIWAFISMWNPEPTTEEERRKRLIKEYDQRLDELKKWADREREESTRAGYLWNLFMGRDPD